MTRVAILQSNYIPWRGYFDLIASVDHFVFYDEVQYTRADWRNRNRIKTPQGAQWLTVPVGASVHRSIAEVSVADPSTGRKHWNRLIQNYRRAACFDETAEWLEPLYLGTPWHCLSDVNQRLIRAICNRMGITTRIGQSAHHPSSGDRNGRLIDLCKAVGADVYVSGPAARVYLDTEAFERAGLTVQWFDYAGYPEYPQPWGPFVGDVSVVDLLFNCGAAAPRYLTRDLS